MAGVLKLLRLRGYPILAQLQLEEALLRTSTANWCITNDGAAETAIVMGISGYAYIAAVCMSQAAGEMLPLLLVVAAAAA